MWLVASFAASAFFTASVVIRGIMSEAILTEKGLLAIASFGTGLTYIIGTKIRGLCTDGDTSLCWSQPDYRDDGSVIPGTLRIRKSIVGVIALRGVFEFIGSTLLLLAFKIALDNSMNQGISSCMMCLAGLMITLMSWCIYGEKLNAAQFVGMGIVIVAVVLMGVFQEPI